MVGLNERFVQPFYLQMQRINAIDADVLPDVIDAAMTASASEVIELLRGEWRPRVMGAWFSVRHDDPTVTSELLQSLRTSQGSLTSPPLATAAVLVAGDGAIESLEAYLEADLNAQWGAAGFVTAAIEHLIGEVTASPDREDFASMMRIAAQIRDT